jgi:stage III sporulation protein AG
MEVFKKLKSMIEGQDRKKLVENTVIVIIIGIIVIVAGSTLFKGKGTDTNQNEKVTAPKTAVSGNTGLLGETGDEARLQVLLSQMKGVGRVDVMITYTTSSENVPAYDTKKNQSGTQEKDSGGGTRSISQEEYDSTLAYEDSSDGGKKPVILKKIEPEVKGVLVVADGADSAEVRERICNSVMVVLDVPAHKVQVVQRKK